jgi:hypothetical protein
MTNDLNEALLTLKLKLIAKQKAERFVIDSKSTLMAEKQKLTKLFKDLKKEEQDVKNLKELSFSSLYYSLIGDKQQQLNTEQEEFFAAKLKFDSCQNSITSLKRDIQNYQKFIDDCDNYEAEYIESIKFTPNRMSTEENVNLITIADEIVNLKSNYTEVNEAIVAGRLAKRSLKKVIDKMQSASNWGLWDVFGGGMIVTAVKHSKINQSQKMIENVKVLIEKFKREISDIKNPLNKDLKIKISGFKKFADYFFDGLIFDWLVQSRIRKCLDAYTDTEKEISRILKLLLMESSNLKKQVKAKNESKLEVFD